MSALSAHQEWAARVRERTQVAHVVLAAVHLLAVVTPLLADETAYWRDEEIVVELTQAHDVWGFLVGWPQWPPHFPTWFVLPELAGYDVAVAVSVLSLPATVYPTYLVGRRYGDAWTGLGAASLVAISPYLATQASWLRMYGPLTALLTWGLWLGLAARWRRAGGCMAAAALVHPFGALGAAWLTLWLLVRGGHTRALRIVGLGMLPAAGVLVGVLARGMAFTNGTTGIFHGIAPGVVRLALLPLSTLAGTPHTLLQITLMLVATGLLAVSIRPARGVGLWVLLPTVAIVGASYALHPIFRPKYFGLLAPAVAVLVATSRHRRLLGLLLAVLVAGSWYQRLSAGALVSRRFIFLTDVPPVTITLNPALDVLILFGAVTVAGLAIAIGTVAAAAERESPPSF